ncbi:peptidase domain-containing ABC transporter [Tenacibaculum amylolyticum]|uniref:peptidase domain-containing ABC transporter n=1 Tax=Tenacibaculum amylolyticum TaxID=104269 RepID=UPI0038B65E9D
MRTLINNVTEEEFKELNINKPLIILDEGELIGVLRKGKKIIVYSKGEEKEVEWERFVQKLTSNNDSLKILTLETSPSFYEKRTRNNQGLKYLMNYIKPFKKFFVQLGFGVLIITTLQIIAPFLTQLLIDNAVNGKDLNLVHVILIALIVLHLSKIISEFIRNWIFLHISTRINLALVSDFLVKLFKLPLGFFNSRSIGDIIQRIDDQKRVEAFLTKSLINILFSSLTFLVFGIILFLYDTDIFLIFISFSISYILWNIYFMKIRKKLDYNIFRLTAYNKNVLIQILDTMQDIKLENLEKQQRWKWERNQVKLFHEKKKMLLYEQFNTLGSVLINEVKNVLILYLAAVAVINGEITLGAMVAVQYIVGQTNRPINEFSKFVLEYQLAIISIKRINSINDENNEHEKINEVITSIPKDNTIVFDNVYYKYSLQKKKVFTLSNISFVIPEKKITAIIGNSGSGKTSLLKMLVKIQNPNGGKITIGGMNLKNIDTRWWRSNCGVILQDSHLFDKTILRNIVGETLDIDMDRLLYAIKSANIHDYIDSLPNGLKTMMRSNGKGLSAGQKQRILLARMIYKNPKFIFMDEATSSLDVKNEFEILENLRDFFKDKTVVIVTHKINRILKADNIILINNGKIIEQGTHHDLIESKNKIYQRMLRLSSIEMV